MEASNCAILPTILWTGISPCRLLKGEAFRHMIPGRLTSFRKCDRHERSSRRLSGFDSASLAAAIAVRPHVSAQTLRKSRPHPSLKLIVSSQNTPHMHVCAYFHQVGGGRLFTGARGTSMRAEYDFRQAQKKHVGSKHVVSCCHEELRVPCAETNFRHLTWGFSARAENGSQIEG